jgi:hypothetical protein
MKVTCLSCALGRHGQCVPGCSCCGRRALVRAVVRALVAALFTSRSRRPWQGRGRSGLHAFAPLGVESCAPTARAPRGWRWARTRQM